MLRLQKRKLTTATGYIDYLFEVHVLVGFPVKDEEVVAHVAAAHVEHADTGRQQLRQSATLALRERPAEARARVVRAGQVELPERRARRHVAHPHAIGNRTANITEEKYETE